MGSIGFNASGKCVISNDTLVKSIGYKDTPITITSWSYVTTTITLNVASHTFVAGDYIEVGGLTATTNLPNGVHLVTSVTATTIVFTYALTPTGTAGVSSATVKGYMITNGRVEAIGVGQTWQDVTGSRVLGTTYTNSTGKPIQVIVKSTYVLGASVYLTVGGIAVADAQVQSGTTSNGWVSAIVPSGATYRVTMTNASILKWSELR